MGALTLIPVLLVDESIFVILDRVELVLVDSRVETPKTVIAEYGDIAESGDRKTNMFILQ